MRPEDRAVLVAAAAVLEAQTAEWEARAGQAESPAVRLACLVAAKRLRSTRLDLTDAVDNQHDLLAALTLLAARAA
jgi:hypothetical protein